MPSPFPGMDPYLEKPYGWQGFHNSLIAALSAQLNQSLPETLFARSEARIYVAERDREDSRRFVRPDMIVVRYPRPRQADNETVALLERPTDKMQLPPLQADPAFEIGVFPVEEREMFINIFAVGDDERIITTIEVLSSGNKRNGVGRTQYIEKRDLILESETHLVEIDLLRTGLPTVAAPIELLPETHRSCSYLISVHRAGAGEFYQTYPRSLWEPLPRFRVPLTREHPDVVVDLQAAMTRTYDEGGYNRSTRYDLPPDPPFSDAEADWADALLREKGIRG